MNLQGTGDLGTVAAAEHPLPVLDTMPDDLAAAVSAAGRKVVNRALEAVEGAHPVSEANLQRPGVVVATDVTTCHVRAPRPSPGLSERRTSQADTLRAPSGSRVGASSRALAHTEQY